jgi:hypothetical protein
VQKNVWCWSYSGHCIRLLDRRPGPEDGADVP